MLSYPKSTPHPLISEVKIIKNRNNFPISWLNKQAFCEYGIFLENFKGISVKPTSAMIKGKEEHSSLESEFREKAVPSTFEEMIITSKTAEILSREFPVISIRYGVRGLIDEIWMTPNDFIVIDDKPGIIPYPSHINQVYGYCLAFKDMIEEERQIVAALRERSTDNIYWTAYFDERAENITVKLINHVHDLISGKKLFKSTKNPNKCRRCRFNKLCDRKIG